MQAQNTSNWDITGSLNAAYSAIQFRLTALQSNPELSKIISATKDFCIPLDVFSLLVTGDEAVRVIKQKYVRQGATQEEHQRFNKKIAVAVASILGFSLASVVGVNYIVKKRLFNQDLMSLVKSPSGTIENFSLQWNSSFLHKIRQFILLNQLIATCTLAYFTKSKLKLVTAVAQLGNLTLMSGQNWIEYTRVVQDPLTEFAKSGATYKFHENGLQQIEITSHFLFQTKDINNATKLSERVNEIASYMKDLFNDSVWTRMHVVEKTKRATITYMQYYVQLATRQLQSCTGIEITGKDTFTGVAEVALIHPQGI